MPAASFELVVFMLIAALAGLAALFAALCFFRMRPQASALTEQAAGRMLRSETDIVRGCGRGSIPWLAPGTGADIGELSGCHA